MFIVARVYEKVITFCTILLVIESPLNEFFLGSESGAEVDSLYGRLIVTTKTDEFPLEELQRFGM